MPIKLICFDLDGTIIYTTASIWQTLHEAFGTDNDERKKAHTAYVNKEISYAKWATHDIEMWKKKGITRQMMAEAIGKLILVKNSVETIEEIKRRGIKTAIISGSINIALETVLPNYNELFDYIYINTMLWNPDGTIRGMVPTEYDFEHKARALLETCSTLNITPKEAMIVGDHDNDVEIAKAAGISIAFNCKSEDLANVSTHIIDSNDLTEILKFV